MIISEQSAQLIEHNNDDLFAVNAARVSFGKWSSVFNINPNTGKRYTRKDSKTGELYEVDGDTRLLQFLIKHDHKTPLMHSRHGFEAEYPIITVPKEVELRASLEFNSKQTKVKHSIYGWIQLLLNGYVNAEYKGSIINKLKEFNPVIMTYFGFDDTYISDNNISYFQTCTEPNFIDVTFRLKAPISVARQLDKHQIALVKNEISRRYVDFEPEFYMPDMLRAKADDKKQGSTDTAIKENKRVLQYLHHQAQDSLDIYNSMLENNVCAEQARMVLPQNMMTEWIWTGSLDAWFRVCNLRLKPDAQKETRDVVELIAEQIKEKYPRQYEWNVNV